jgi:hypothetical protein
VLEATCSAEVSVDLDAPMGRALRVQELQAPGGAPPLSGVSIEALDPPKLRVLVPAGQPAGVYSGLVVDAETNLQAGSVTVRVPPVGTPSP